MENTNNSVRPLKIYPLSIMPFRIDKVKNGYKLYNLDKKRYAKPTFKTKLAATNQKKNWMRYAKT